MRRSRPLIPLLFTVFIDLIGVGIVLPVLAPLFLSVDSPLSDASWSHDTRILLIGLLAACFPLAQFFGAPILGAMSDRWGRKPILLISLVGTFVGYLFFALALRWHAVWLLFVSRSFAGFAGGNVSTANSAISDLSTEESKAKNFGLIGMAYGLGFILGPYIGGRLAASFDPAAPFWFAAGLSVVNIVLVALLFGETLRERLHRRLSLLTGFENVLKAFRLPDVRTMFVIVFLFTLSLNFFTQFFQVLGIEKYGFTETAIGNFFAYIGIWFALVQGVVTRFVAARVRPGHVLPFSLLLWALAVAALAIPREVWVLYAITPIMALAVGLTQPNATAIISNLADRKSQGEMLGINQSVTAFATALPPIIAGFIARFNIYLPIVVSAALVFAAWAVFVFIFERERLLIFHEK